MEKAFDYTALSRADKARFTREDNKLIDLREARAEMAFKAYREATDKAEEMSREKVEEIRKSAREEIEIIGQKIKALKEQQEEIEKISHKAISQTRDEAREALNVASLWQIYCSASKNAMTLYKEEREALKVKYTL